MLFGFLFTVSGFFSYSTIQTESSSTGLRGAVTHDPIIINGNWTETKSAGICSGSGTPEDPYTIEDKDVEGDGVGNCITITNAHEYFTIENCTIHGSGNLLDDAGICIENASNGIINKNGINGNRYGILIIDAIHKQGIASILNTSSLYV